MKKKILLLFFILIFFGLKSHGQAPLQFNYQGAARNASGTPLANKNISIRISILDGSASGSIQYSESRTVTTNSLGLYSVTIGSSGAITTTGSIDLVSWASGPKFIRIEVDLNNGNNYSIAGTSQLLSVPYAIYAAKGPASKPETITVLTDNNNGTYTFRSEDNTITIVDVPGSVKSNFQTIINDEVVSGLIGKFISQHIANLSYNATTKSFSYIDPLGKPQTLNLSMPSIVAADVTTDASGKLILTNNLGAVLKPLTIKIDESKLVIPSGSVLGNNLSSTDLNISGGTGAVLKTVTANINSNAVTTAKIADKNVTIAKLGTTGVTDANKVYTTDATGNPVLASLSGIVQSAETLTKLVDNGDGTITYIDEKSNPTIIKIPTGSVPVAGVDVTTEASGKLILTNNIGAALKPLTIKIDESKLVIPSNSVVGNNFSSTDLNISGGTGAVLKTVTANINSNAVTTAKIADKNVTIAKLGTSGVTDANKVYKTDAAGNPVLVPFLAAIKSAETLTKLVDNGNGTVTYTDEQSNATIINVSAGPKGPAGADGATGAQGPQGPIGIPGAQGLQGPQGPAGTTGAQGPQGPAGADGATGAQGPQGPIGPAGAPGIQGSQGPAGPAGATGAQGPAGADGARGAQGEQGPTGSIGLTGAQGPQGPAGKTGAQGPQGVQGVAGVGGKTTAGTNVTITGTGTNSDPYIINATVPNYSNSEQLTGRLWYDNITPVYWKTFTYSLSTNNSVFDLSGAFASGYLKQVISVIIINKANNGITRDINNYDYNTNKLTTGIGATATIHLAGSYEIILEYLKK
ncbi:MAG: collagen-like protein [Sphingobacteriaceae bacterium]|nr:collagen-like protein [Sphingobacteriaceae bacterium]